MTKIVLIESALIWLNLKHLLWAAASNHGNPNYSAQLPFLPNNQLTTLASYVKQALRTTHPHLQRKQQHPQTKADNTRANVASFILIRRQQIKLERMNEPLRPKDALTIF